MKAALFGINECTSEKGSSLITMIVMISALFIIASTLLFMVLSFFKLNKVFQASENLYFETSRVTQVLAQELEIRVKDIIEGIEVYDYAGPELIPSTIYTPIFNEFGTGAGYSNAAELRDTLISYAGSVDPNIKDDISKALFDITFKLKVKDDSLNTSILYHDASTTPTSNPALTFIQSLATFQDSNPLGERNFVVEEIGTNTDLPTDVRNGIENWLADIKDGTYDNYGGLDEYNTIVYSVLTENERVELAKRLEITFEACSQEFTDDIDTQDSAGVLGYNNSRLGKVLAATGNINISGTGQINLDGDVYAYGSLPSDMTANILDTADYGGIHFNSSQEVNITGSTVTRGYLSANESNSTINIKGHTVCDTLYLADGKSNIDFTIGTVGDDVRNANSSYLATFDDVRVGSSDSYLKIVGNYYGLNNGSTTNINKSSSIVLNAPVDSTPSYVRVYGQALIGGVAFAGNITRDIGGKDYAFKTGESASIGDNFLLYSYRLSESSLGAPTSSSVPSYNINEANDYPSWNIENFSAGSTQLPLLDPNSSVPNDINKTDNLKSHFYHYIRLRESDPDGYLLFNFQPSGQGIILNKNKSHYAPGIVCAQAYTDSDGDGMADGETTISQLDPSSLQGRFYWLIGSVSNILNNFESLTAAPMDPTAYITKANAEKTKAIDEVSFYKIYNDNAYADSTINPNNGITTEDEYSDEGGFLIGGLTSNKYMCNENSDFFYFVTKDAKNITIGSAASNYSTGGIISSAASNININYADINGKAGIIYTKGNVTINPGADFDFDGVIISNGGNITINSNYEVSLSNSDIETTYNDPFFRDIRRFFAPGNEQELLEGTDVYSGSGQNVRLVGKKLLKN